MQKDKFSSAPGFRVSALIVLVVLAVPCLYFLLSSPRAQRVQASVEPQPAADTVSALEALVQREPTPQNRINLSQAYINQGMYGPAIDLLTKLTAQSPESVIAWNNLCVAHTLQQELSLALDACNKGIAADGNFQLLRNNLHWAESERDKTVAALAQQEQTAPTARDANFYLGEGLNYLHLGDYDQAIGAWRRSLEINPKSSLAHNNIGTAQMMQHHYPEAEASFRQASALDPSSQLVRNNLAWATRTEAASH